jgi:hypothetical protein
VEGGRSILGSEQFSPQPASSPGQGVPTIGGQAGSPYQLRLQAGHRDGQWLAADSRRVGVKALMRNDVTERISEPESLA